MKKFGKICRGKLWALLISVLVLRVYCVKSKLHVN